MYIERHTHIQLINMYLHVYIYIYRNYIIYKYILRWPRELNALQLQKTHANRKSTSKSRKHFHQFDHCNILYINVGVGDMAKISYHNLFRNINFFHDSLSCWFLIFCLSSAAKLISLLQRQSLSRLQNIKKNGVYLGQSGRR